MSSCWEGGSMSSYREGKYEFVLGWGEYEFVQGREV
jgi:hypothetical protein